MNRTLTPEEEDVYDAMNLELNEFKRKIYEIAKQSRLSDEQGFEVAIELLITAIAANSVLLVVEREMNGKLGCYLPGEETVVNEICQEGGIADQLVAAARVANEVFNENVARITSEVHMGPISGARH